MKKTLSLLLCFILVFSAAQSNNIASSLNKTQVTPQRAGDGNNYLNTSALLRFKATNPVSYFANYTRSFEAFNETDETEALYADDRVIVKLKTSDLNARARFPAESILDLGVSVSHSRLINPSKRKNVIRSETTDRQNNTFVLTLKNPGKQAVQDAVRKLNANSNVEYATPDYYLELFETRPNDPMYSQQWGLETIQAPKAWSVTTGSAMVVVGIIDSGFAYHPDLVSNLWNNDAEIPDNGIDDDGNGYIDDVYGFNFATHTGGVQYDKVGHGTMVAGVVGAAGNNAIGVAGVNWNVKIASLQVSDQLGSVLVTAMIEAINYAQNMGIPIINSSVGTSAYNSSMYEAVANYEGLLITAAGNDGKNRTIYPAGYDLSNIISVAATDKTDKLASFSNYGQHIHIAAPGVSIMSTSASNGYYSSDGTSFASPMVAGVAALTKTVHPEYTTAQIKAAILDNADVLPGLSAIQGGRRLNAGFLADEPISGDILYGDFTGNESVDGTDILWIQRYIASGRNLTTMKQNYPTTIESFNEEAGDFTHNGRVDGTDILWIQRYIASELNADEMLRNYPTTIDFSHL